jgi:hypothetical protein
MDKPNKDATKYSIFFDSKLLFQTVTKTQIVIKQQFLYKTITVRIKALCLQICQKKIKVEKKI